ncbi:hypothetical protein K413DRAFT_4752 [Clostridium sp. ASBs410]|nr:hypothetical protein K413DRAFT_4752 [Clostridium sp. ASBs410]
MNIFNKIKNYFESRKQEKIKENDFRETFMAISLYVLNQHSDLLELQTELVKKQMEATESINKLNESVSVDDMKNLMQNIDKISKNPDLTSTYYSHIADITQAEKG